MNSRPRTKPSRQMGKERYRYIQFDSQPSESIDLPLHIAKSPILNKTTVRGLCGDKTNQHFTLAGFVTDNYVKEFPRKMCQSCVDLWKSVLIVEE